MSDDSKDKRNTKGGTGSAAKTSGGRRSGDRDVGHALRSVYASTVNEEIPSELLDLLGKLS